MVTVLSIVDSSPLAPIRLQQLTFETDIPTIVKEKLRAAVPTGSNTVLYKTLPEFTAAFPHSTNLEWIEHELRALPENQTSYTELMPAGNSK